MEKILNRERMGKNYHPLRERIVRAIEANPEKRMSPNELSKELDEPLGNVSYHVNCLFKVGALRLNKTEPRRGAIEHYYAIVPGVLLDPDGDHAALQRIAELMPPADEGLLGQIVKILNDAGYEAGVGKLAAVA